eukprot:CAMPEP_0174922848 /NCGR_PEP_ID=MMETSP1355-20121228/6179_1 /TAXON_ID=464990 /ORGANISM="Hemiselmis tepida, Strain CCMP443" /LENGTH=61 /DNA_ID=CAMNT_0016168487 /DNA_START=15 /DNA_END=196 /DNA_ORIENTATION=-
MATSSDTWGAHCLTARPPPNPRPHGGPAISHHHPSPAWGAPPNGGTPREYPHRVFLFTVVL